MHSQIDFALQAIDEGFNRTAWHGTNLRGSIRRVKAIQAAWRPETGRHNIWEIIVHTAYWKYAVRRRILGEKRGSFTLVGSDWFERPEKLTEDAWKAYVVLLEEEHQKMRDAVSSLSDASLEAVSGKGRTTLGALIRGITAHDVYHAGQIQLLKRLYSSSQSE
jgi:hypothetical protein